MKKKLITIFVISIIILTGCMKQNSNVTKDEKKFKEEYESLNGKKQNDKTIMPISIVDDNKMKYVDSKEVIDILENKTGVIYFGFPECPWCRNVVPVLIDAAKETSLDKIYYANLLEERDSKHLDDSENIQTDKKGSENYYKIVDLLSEHLGVYEGLEDETIKRLYFPTVVFVKNGKVEDIHIGTLDSQKDPYKALSKKEKDKLRKIFIEKIEKTKKITCDTDRTC